MAHYRKIDVKIWNDARMVKLKPLAKLAFLFVITHPNMTSVGAMRATVAGMSAELGVSQKDFSEVIDSGMVKYDEQSLCMFVPNFLRYQTAESPNVIKNWVKQLAYIPEGFLKDEAIASMKDYVEGSKEGFRKAFREAFGKAFGKAFPEALQKDYANTVSSKQLAVTTLHPSQEGEDGGGVYTGLDFDPVTGEVFGGAE